tara:strand:- start:601 stop:1161 length:561 start_codon:yes stop_codon:yes gene_type:complete
MIYNFYKTTRYYCAVVASIFPIVSYADNVDEAAKCAATFRILTSIELIDENLGQYFTKQNLFVYDLIGLYAEHYRNRNLSNGETSRLITKYQLDFDAKSNNGSYFIPYVKSCMGWTYKVSKDLQNSKNMKNSKNIKKILIESATPSLKHSYPHSDWTQMEQIYFLAYSEWENMGKITPKSIRDALK